MGTKLKSGEALSGREGVGGEGRKSLSGAGGGGEDVRRLEALPGAAGAVGPAGLALAWHGAVGPDAVLIRVLLVQGVSPGLPKRGTRGWGCGHCMHQDFNKHAADTILL